MAGEISDSDPAKTVKVGGAGPAFRAEIDSFRGFRR